MQKQLQAISDALTFLSAKVTNADSTDTYLNAQHGWHHPSLSRLDLAEIPLYLVRKLESFDIKEVGVEWVDILAPLPDQINHLAASNTISYMFNGHGHQAIPAYMSTLEYINKTVEPLFEWETLKDTKLMPAKLMARLRSIQTSIDELETKKENLQQDIKIIRDARETAESLPTDLASLKEARNTLNKYNTESSELKGKMDVFYKDATDHTNYIKDKKVETDKLVEQCEEAYRITTTKGLAAAFDERANKLSSSMWIWVIGLILALVVGSLIGSQRLSVLSSALKATTPSWGVIMMHVILSVLSIGAPLWLAWLATKQIGQRFRLSEDYAFKASVAKAYEGYRKEAARIDPAFEARLFGSALTRLEEAPLRLVEEDSHGSPWHEMFRSKAVQNNLSVIPDLKDKLLGKNAKELNKREVLASTEIEEEQLDKT